MDGTTWQHRCRSWHMGYNSSIDTFLPVRCTFRKCCTKTRILTRKQNDGKALAELDSKLRESNDPVKYDFALFGLGVFEGFSNFLLIIIFFDTRCFPQQLLYRCNCLLNSFICYFSLILIFYKNMHFIGFFTTNRKHKWICNIFE
jgi:hypothetical protein